MDILVVFLAFSKILQFFYLLKTTLFPHMILVDSRAADGLFVAFSLFFFAYRVSGENWMQVRADVNFIQLFDRKGVPATPTTHELILSIRPRGGLG